MPCSRRDGQDGVVNLMLGFPLIDINDCDFIDTDFPVFCPMCTFITEKKTAFDQ
jgi:hypothetical protein